jgi:hypothetical protein
LSRDSRVISAARLSQAFHTNPLTLMDLPEDLWLILHACGNVVQRDQEAALKKSQSG